MWIGCWVLVMFWTVLMVAMGYAFGYWHGSMKRRQ